MALRLPRPAVAVPGVDSNIFEAASFEKVTYFLLRVVFSPPWIKLIVNHQAALVRS